MYPKLEIYRDGWKKNSHAIGVNNYYLLHVLPSERTEENICKVVDVLNAAITLLNIFKAELPIDGEEYYKIEHAAFRRLEGSVKQLLDSVEREQNEDNSH